jgi:hypothetical protein
MNTHIDFRTLPNNIPSLCIPRVFTNWTESRIRKIFDDLSLGEILRIDVISKNTEKGEKFNRVFVHYKHWFSNPNADMARERLLNGKDIKIVYDEPWFWKITAYRETRNEKSSALRNRVPIKIDDSLDHKHKSNVRDKEHKRYPSKSQQQQQESIKEPPGNLSS